MYSQCCDAYSSVKGGIMAQASPYTVVMQELFELLATVKCDPFYAEPNRMIRRDLNTYSYLFFVKIDLQFKCMIIVKI